MHTIRAHAPRVTNDGQCGRPANCFQCSDCLSNKVSVANIFRQQLHLSKPGLPRKRATTPAWFESASASITMRAGPCATGHSQSHESTSWPGQADACGRVLPQQRCARLPRSPDSRICSDRSVSYADSIRRAVPRCAPHLLQCPLDGHDPHTCACLSCLQGPVRHNSCRGGRTASRRATAQPLSTTGGLTQQAPAGCALPPQQPQRPRRHPRKRGHPQRRRRASRSRACGYHGAWRRSTTERSWASERTSLRTTR